MPQTSSGTRGTFKKPPPVPYDPGALMRHVQSYVITFHEIRSNGGTRSLGSGTLVRWKDCAVVLSARHVLQTIEQLGENVTYIRDSSIIERQALREETGRSPWGLPQWRFPGGVRIITTPPTELVPSLDQSLTIRTRGGRSADRPDLGVLVLNHKMMNRLGPIDSFYDLEAGCRRWQVCRSGSGIVSRPSQNPEGLFGIMGLIGDLQEDPRRDPDGVLVDRPYIHSAVSGNVTPFYTVESDGYAYEYRHFITADQDGHTCAAGSGQTSWAGMSGAGLWEFVGRAKNISLSGVPTVVEPVLVGVVFAEAGSPVARDPAPPDVLVCHSDASIYPRVVDMISLAS